MGLDAAPDFVVINLFKTVELLFALSYFGGKAYYFSEGLSFVNVLDNPYPATPEEDALANYVVWDYTRRQ